MKEEAERSTPAPGSETGLPHRLGQPGGWVLQPAEKYHASKCMFLHVVCSRATASEAQGAKITSERKKTSELRIVARLH